MKRSHENTSRTVARSDAIWAWATGPVRGRTSKSSASCATTYITPNINLVANQSKGRELQKLPAVRQVLSAPLGRTPVRRSPGLPLWDTAPPPSLIEVDGPRHDKL